MAELAVFEDLAELRDAVLIVVGVTACAAALVFLVLVVKVSLTAWRVARRLERFHARRIEGAVEAADARLAAWLEEDRWSPRGMLELIRIAARRAQERRRPPPKKRRLFGLLPPA